VTMSLSRKGSPHPFEELIGRDIYYRDPVLFGKQGVVDRIVDGLAYTLLIPRTCLHVVRPLWS